MSVLNVLDYGDYKGALLQYLIQHPLITGGIPALGLAGCPANRIRGRRPQKENDAIGPYITARKVGRWLAQDTPNRSFTCDVWCFGTTGKNAADLDRLVQLVLCPDYPAVIGFTAAGVNVTDIRDISGPMESVELETLWPVCIRTYVLSVTPAQVEVTV